MTRVRIPPLQMLTLLEEPVLYFSGPISLFFALTGIRLSRDMILCKETPSMYIYKRIFSSGHSIAHELDDPN